MARDEDAAAVFRRKHGAGIEPHAKRRRMGSELGNRGNELTARMAPAELVVRHVALVAIRISEMLPHFGDAIELVVW